MRHFALAIALACALSGSVLAGDIHTAGAPEPAPGDAHSTDAPAPTTQSSVAAEVMLAILSLIS
jgi:hypothetical protein